MLDNIFKAWILRPPTLRRASRERDTTASVSLMPMESLLLYLNFFGLPVIPLLYLFTPWLDLANYGLPAWAGWIGVTILVAAVWLVWRSQKDLGNNWSSLLQIKETHTVITSCNSAIFGTRITQRTDSGESLRHYYCGIGSLVCPSWYYLRRSTYSGLGARNR